MTALLILAMLGILLLGYFIVGWIDAFIGGGGLTDRPQSRANMGVLLLGSDGDGARLRGAGCRCVKAASPTSWPLGRYSALFALGERDGDNLTICRKMKAYDPGVYIVARCHAPELQQAYREAGADHVLEPWTNLNGILAQLEENRSEW